MGPRVVVVGSLNMDLVARLPRWPEAGETLPALSLQTLPGGKGLNQAVAAARAGAGVTLIGRVGSDPWGEALRQQLQAEGIDTSPIGVDAAGTGVALVLLEPSGENRIVIVPGANARLTPDDVAQAVGSGAGADVLVLQGEVPLEASLAAAQRLAGAGKPVVFNPAPVPPPSPSRQQLLRLATLVVVNERELQALAGAAGELGAQRLRARTGGPVVVTLGARGALVMEHPDGVGQYLPAFAVRAVDTVGAGDAFVGNLAVAWAEGRPLAQALVWAMAAGALATTVPGAMPAMPRRRAVAALADQGLRA